MGKPTIVIAVDAASPPDGVRTETVTKGTQDLEWVVLGAKELLVEFPTDAIYDPDLHVYPELARKSRAKLGANPVTYAKILGTGSRPAIRATLRSGAHVSAGWLYYRLVIQDQNGVVKTVDPYVIIQP